MKGACVATLSLCLVLRLWASETNLLPFAYSFSETPLAERPDVCGRALNDGDWMEGDAVGFGQSVNVTLDLFVPTSVDRVRVYAGTSGVSRTAAVSLEGSADGAAWYGLGAMSPDADGGFAKDLLCCRVRHLRVTCQKAPSAPSHDIAEIVVDGRQRASLALKAFTYTASLAVNPKHPENPTSTKLTDRAYQTVSEAVQFGPSDSGELAAYAVATNVALLVDFGGTVSNLTRVSLYAHSATNNGNWGTDGIAVSNSADGVVWELAGVQSHFAVLPGDQYGVVRRFDVLLPCSTSRYLAVAAQKTPKAAVLRQFLNELEVTASTTQTSYAAGERIPYTYTVDKATSQSNESAYAPKLTDLCYEHVTRHALRFYEQEVTVTADLGYPQHVHSGFAYTWGSPTKYTSTADYYGTQQVDCYGSLDNASWTFLGTLAGTGSGPKTNSFAQLPLARYVKATFIRMASTETKEVSSQILGELAFYGLPKQVIGSLVEAPQAIPVAGFETEPLLDAATLAAGGVVNGWTFSSADAGNYSGCQRNGSSVSTNSIALAKFLAPEGVQTAVMRGTNAFMEAQIALSAAGHYLLQLQASSLAFSTSSEVTGYNFRVLVDGAEKGVVDVQTIPFSQKQLSLGALSAGAHTLRFQALNSRNCPAGTLLDDLRLLRVPAVGEVSGAEPRRSQSVFMAGVEPVALNFVGELYLRNLIVDGQSLPHRSYAPDNTPSLFSGFGVIRFVDGFCILLR